MNSKELDKYESIWLDSWLIVAGASNCADSKAPARWADQCLKDFKERFDKETQNER